MKAPKNHTVLCICMVIYILGCSKGNNGGNSAGNISLAAVTVISASGVGTTTATTGGNISSDGGSSISARGVCWNTATNPTILNSKTVDGSGAGSFTSNITGLTPNTTYYIRAYATNSAGTAYSSSEEVFTTVAPGVLATVTVTLGSGVGTTSITTGGNVTSDGGSVVTARGVCWSTSQNPTISNPKTVDGSGTGSFTSNVTGLTPNTIYYVRAYATNNAGTAYSASQFTFQTSPSHSIGDIYQGGAIFYIDASGEHGLIAAVQSMPAYTSWYNGTYILIGTTSTAVGSGQANTTAIVNAQGPGNYAASICDNLVLNGYSDWYLPSKDELNLLYQHRGSTLIVQLEGYWSSSEVDKNNAWAQTFDNTTIVKSQDKNGVSLGAKYVRPIRSF
jgi:hypothetical protein